MDAGGAVLLSWRYEHVGSQAGRRAVARSLEREELGNEHYIGSFPVHITQHFCQNRSVDISDEFGYKGNKI